MNNQNTSISFLEFAWHSLTDDQQIRINVKYDIVKELSRLDKGDCKRNVYRAIADKYNYTMERIEWIANHKISNLNHYVGDETGIN